MIESQKDHYHARLDDEGLDMMPNSLPSLRLLRITRCLGVPHAAMAGLSSAAGPNLTKLDVVKHDGAQAAARLIAAEDYCWLSSLRAVAAAHNQDSPELLANAVGRLPALTSLQVTSLSYDELLVRLMAAADNGTLPRPPKLVLHPSAGECHVSNGARLLLVLWLKEQAKKAVAGQAPAVKWEVELVDYQYGRPPYISKVTDKCLAQIKAAWAQVEGN